MKSDLKNKIIVLHTKISQKTRFSFSLNCLKGDILISSDLLSEHHSTEQCFVLSNEVLHKLLTK